MSRLRFRNVDADVAAPVSTWPYEALVSAIERGSLSDWRRIAAAIRDDPWGDVARDVEAYLSYAEPSGVATLLGRAIARARQGARQEERSIVGARVRELVRRSGLARADFARRAGTSESRLSTYCSGSVLPSAGMMVRFERLAERNSR
ncbi:MAG TPA: helix-turn-helix transcriptional regulator [Marmoricola sp.]|nr:helix-turn-helix transcriptional regulator [Marmoricola sp.]